MNTDECARCGAWRIYHDATHPEHKASDACMDFEDQDQLAESHAADAHNRAQITRLNMIEDVQHERGVLRYAAHITAGLACCTPKEVTL